MLEVCLEPDVSVFDMDPPQKKEKKNEKKDGVSVLHSNSILPEEDSLKHSVINLLYTYVFILFFFITYSPIG